MRRLLTALTTLALLVQDPSPPVAVHVRSTAAWAGVIRVSVPWPRGIHADLAAVRIGADTAPCVSLMRWPDGSVAVSQVHARLSLPAAGEYGFGVVPLDALAEPVETSAAFALDGPLPLHTELQDAWGRTYRAVLTPDPAGAVDTALSSARVRVRRFRGIHARTDAGVTTALISTQAWLTEFAGESRAELIVLLDADPRAGEVVTGPLRFRSFALRSTRSDLRLRVRHAALQHVPAVEVDAGGCERICLLGPSDALYLGDRTGKAFRIDLAFGNPATDPVQPPFAVPDVEFVRATGAFGRHGGPAPEPIDATGLGERLLRQWQDRGGFAGPFALFGDRSDLAREPTRAAPCTLHGVLRWRSPDLLALAELTVTQHTLRPTPGTEARLPSTATALRAGLGPRALARPHGVRALDYEHCDLGLLFDFYWLTGDPLVRHELARVGPALLPLLRGVPFRTSGGEAACLAAGVAIARATGDRALMAALVDHARGAVLSGLETAPRGCAIPQPAHPRALGPEVPFDAPEQMARLALALAALADAAGEPALNDAAVAIVRRIATDGWIDGDGPAGYVSADDVMVRVGPPGAAARAGSAATVLCALVIAGEIAGSESDRSLFSRRVDELLRDPSMPSREATLADPWYQVPHDRRLPIR